MLTCHEGSALPWLQVWVTMALFIFLFIFAVIVCTMVGQDIDIRRVSWHENGFQCPELQLHVPLIPSPLF